MNVFAVAAGAEDDSVVLAAMTGSGDFYCSGNDLGNFMNITPDQMAEHAVKGTSQEWPVGWFWGMERVFVGWKVHLSHSATYHWCVYSQSTPLD